MSEENHERQEGWTVPIDRMQAFASGAAMAVDLSDIEKELAGLWRQAAERAQAGAPFAVIRAWTWTLVVQVSGEAELRRVKPVLDEAAHALPGRAIVLCASDPEGVFAGDEEPLRAFVEANVRTGAGGRREMVGEEITLEARHMETRRLPGLVRSLLLPDLPTAMFVPGPTVPLCDILTEADRLVIDTGRLADGAALREFGRGLISVLSERGPSGLQRTEVADLGWLRLQPWRLAVAALFDAPEAQAELPSLDEVEIRHRPGAEAAALLLWGWLLCRLGPRVRLKRVEDPAAAATCPAGIAAVVVHVMKDGGRSLRACGASACGRSRRDSELLVTALSAYGRDPMMLAALRAILALPGRAGKAHP